MSNTPHYTPLEIEEIQRDVRYNWFAAKLRNDHATHSRCSSWHVQHITGATVEKHYPDAHCVLKDFKSLRQLEWFTVVAPGGVRFSAPAFLLLCTLPFYSHHHEGSNG